MARVMTVREICERALRKIGSYAIIDTGADGDEIAEARYWLDMLMGHVTASQRTWWLVPATVSFALRAEETTYAILQELTAADRPVDGIQFVIAANLREVDNGRETPLEIVRRVVYEDVEQKTQTGTPRMVYIDRGETPTLKVWPVPAADGQFEVMLTFQTYSDNLTQGSPEFVANFRQSWNLFLVTALAAEIGAGPVRRLPGGEIQALEKKAKLLLEDLLAYDNHEQADEPRFTASFGL